MINKRNLLRRTVLYTIVCIASAIILGTILMIGVYCLPVQNMRENARKSSAIYEVEGEYYSWAPNIKSSQLDNFTDALMINNATFLGTGSVIHDAMMNPFVTYDEVSTQTQYMMKSVSEDMFGGGVVNYARYWHGYLIWLKPLLMIFTISDIRMISMCFQLVLLLAIILELYQLGGYRKVVPFTLAILSINPISTAICMQHACIYCIMLIAVYIMLRFRVYRSKDYWKLFLWIGIATAFFDFLTYPIVGLGITLALLLILQNESFRCQMIKIMKSSFFWGIGYGGMWVGKWVAASILTGYNVVADGISAVKYRSAGSVEWTDINCWNVIWRNCKQLCNKPVCIISAIIVITIIVLILTGKFQFKLDKMHLMAMFIISLYPFVWYCIARNHSVIHSWMTYRDLSIVIFAISYIIINSVVTREIKKEG